MAEKKQNNNALGDDFYNNLNQKLSQKQKKQPDDKQSDGLGDDFYQNLNNSLSKKKESTGGDLSLNGTEQEQGGQSLSDTTDQQLFDTSPEAIKQTVTNRFYSEIGATPLNQKVDEYKKAVQDGVDPRFAAQRAGLRYNELNQNGETIIQPEIPAEDKNIAKKADDYVRQHFPEEAARRVNHNIDVRNNQYFSKETKTPEDFEQYYEGTVEDFRKKYVYEQMAELPEEDESAEEQTPSDEINTEDALSEVMRIAQQGENDRAKIEEMTPQKFKRNATIAEVRQDFESLKNLMVDAWEEVERPPEEEKPETIGDLMSKSFMAGPIGGQINTIKAIVKQQFGREETPYLEKLQESREKFRDKEGLLKSLFKDTEGIDDLEYSHELFALSKDLIEDSDLLLTKIESSDGGILPDLGKGVVSGISDYFSSYKKTIDKMRQRNSFKTFQNKLTKIQEGDLALDDLSDEEFMLIQSLSSSQAMAQKFKNDVPMAREVGETLGGMVGFMGEMALTGGIGKAMSGVVKANTLRALSAGRMTPTLNAKMTSQALGAMSGAAVQTTAMPMLYKEAAQEWANGNGLYESIAKGSFNTFTEVFSEKMFTTPLNKFAKGTGGAPKFWNRIDSAFGNVQGIAPGLRNTFLEWTEEIFAGSAQAYAEGGLEAVGEFATDARQQENLAWSMLAMGLGGKGINKVDKMRVNWKHKQLGQGLGNLKETLDEILIAEDINIDEVNAATTRATDDFLSANDIQDSDSRRAYHAQAKAYTALGASIQSHETSAPDRDNPNLMGNEFVPNSEVKPESEAETEVVQSGNGYSINKAGNQEYVTFDDWLNDVTNKVATGKAIPMEDLQAAQKSLGEMLEGLTDNQHKEVISDYLDSINTFIEDSHTQEEFQSQVSAKPSFRYRPGAKPIKPDNDADSQSMYDISVGQNMAGKVQETTKNNKTTYTAFDTKNNEIGTYQKRESAFKAVVEGKRKKTPYKPKPIKQKKQVKVDRTTTKLYQLSQNPQTLEQNKKRGTKMLEELGLTIGVEENLRGAKLRKRMDETLQGNNIDLPADMVDMAMANIKSDLAELTSKPTSPSVSRILGQRVPEGLVNEYKALKDQLKLEARAARQGAMAQKKKLKDVTDSVSKMAEKGKISSKQASQLIKKAGNLNLDNAISKQKYLDYAAKVFSDANYQDKLAKANNAKRKLKSAMKGDHKPGNLRNAAKEFRKLDPQNVEDLDTYTEHAETLSAALKGPRKSPTGETQTPEMANLNVINPYINEQKVRQQEIMEAQEQAALDEVAETEGLTDAEINEISKDEAKRANFIASAGTEIATAKNTVRKMLNTNKDVDGNPLGLTVQEKLEVQQFLRIEPSHMDPSMVKGIITSLNNFITNGGVHGMGNLYARYLGNKRMNELAARGNVIAGNFMSIAKIIGPRVSNQMGIAFAPLPVFFENMFRGQAAKTQFFKASGLQDLINNKAKAQRITDLLSNEYDRAYKKKLANGEKFYAPVNVVERGVFAAMARHESEDTRQQEFDVMKQRVADSIEHLKQGDKNKQRVAEEYQKAYDRLLEGAETFEQFESRVDQTNKDAVNWWINKWNIFYPDLSEIASAVYNKELDHDFNYTSLTYRRVNPGQQKKIEDYSIEEGANSSKYLTTTGVYDKETGVLMDKRKFEKLPPDKYLDLNFDMNMVSAMNGAQMDIYTSRSIKQLDAAFKSEGIRKVFPTEDTMRAARKRVESLINDTKGRPSMQDQDMRAFERSVNYLGRIGVNRALGQIGQFAKQTVSVMGNTVINAGTFDMSYIYNADVRDFVDRSGRGIAIRGEKSSIQIASIEQTIESTNLIGPNIAQEALQKVGQISDWYLDTFLVQPDIAVARASWFTYYKQGLREKANMTDSMIWQIDWGTHKVNNKAADYAQDMVDRQQNVSDGDMLGEFFKSRNPGLNLVRKLLFPFAGFIVNQKMRMYTDIGILTAGSRSSVLDKKQAMRSLPGLLVEQAIFNTIAHFIREFLTYSMNEIWGFQDTEKEKQERSLRSMSYSIKNIFTDIVSPMPLLDDAVQFGAAKGMQQIDEAPDWIDMMPRFANDPWDSYGVLGVGAKTLSDLFDIADAAYGDTYTGEYLGNRFEKYLLERDKDMTQLGFWMHYLHTWGVLPKEFGQLAKNIKYKALERSITPKEYQKIRDGWTPNGRIEMGEYSRPSEGKREREGGERTR